MAKTKYNKNYTYKVMKDYISNLDDYQLFVLYTMRLSQNRNLTTAVAHRPAAIYFNATGHHDVSYYILKQIETAVNSLSGEYISIYNKDCADLVPFLEKEGSGGYFVIDNIESFRSIFRSDFSIIYKTHLYHFWLKLLCLIMSDTKVCRMTYDTIAKQTGISTCSAYKYIKDLEDLGVIYVYHMNGRKGKEGSWYRLMNVIGRYEDKDAVIKAGEVACRRDKDFVEDGEGKG